MFHGFPLGFYLIAGVTALILVLAANTAFNGFPVLGSILAQDRYLPRQLHTRGDRLAFSNGILFLAFAAIAFIVAFQAEVTALIQLYIVGVFVSFTLSQIGMVRHWTRLLRVETDPAARRRMMRSRVINTIGFICTGAVLIIVVVTKFLAGAWIAILAMGSLFVHDEADPQALRRRRARTGRAGGREDGGDRAAQPQPRRSCWCPSCTCRRCARWPTPAPPGPTSWRRSPSASTTPRPASWCTSGRTATSRVPLKVIASPYREITRPVLEYVKRVSKESPRTVVTVFIPEYVVGHWWEQVLHNQSALRLKGRLLFSRA